MSKNKYTRCVFENCKVWEKRYWGWKFLGISKSLHAIHVLDVKSHDCDHPEDIFEGLNELSV